MRKFLTFAVVCVFSALFGLGPLQEALGKKHPENSSLFWVHRRDKDDQDRNQNTAVVLQIRRQPDQQGNIKIQAVIWKYKGYGGNKFTGREGPFYAEIDAFDEHGNGPRMRTEMVLREPGTGKVYAYATLFRGRDASNNSAGRSHQRLILRWPRSAVQTDSGGPKGANQGKPETRNCDDPPDDDPMEEEPVETDDSGNPIQPLDDPEPDPDP